MIVYRTRMNRQRKADLQLVGRVYTSDPHVLLPPGILAPAEVYVLVIQADQGQGLDAQHPDTEPLRRASASCVTALFSP